MTSKTKSLAPLAQVLSYTFKNEALLVLAMSHRSMGSNNNERLEFLGDSLVNLIIAEAVFQKYPKAKEGELSRLRSSLVSGEALAGVAREFGLGDYIYLGHGELKSGGHKRSSILGCTVEAIIGAIYLDSDFNQCQATVLRWFESRLQALSLDNEYKDAKTQLQEYLQASQIGLPEYTLLKTEGQSHEQVFTIQCEVKKLSIKTTAEGGSRRKAEKLAASALLEEIKNDK